jgi:hypothetical protein
MMRIMSFAPSRARFSSAIYAAGMFGSCELSLGPRHDIRLPITDLVAPAEIAADSVLTVRVTVESGGCRRLEQLRVTRTPSRATIVAYGFDTEGPGVNCPADIRHDVRQVSLDPPFSDPFTLVARQPNGSDTVRVVRVR